MYGSVNRTGLVIAGAALVGVSGLAFLGELNAIPNVDGVADSVKGFQGFMEGVVSRFQVKLFNFTRVKISKNEFILHRAPSSPASALFRASSPLGWTLWTELTQSTPCLDRELQFSQCECACNF